MPASRRCVPVLLRLALLAALLAAAPAQALRCDGRLVGTGDHAVQVERRCGEPYWIESYSEWLVVGENQALERRIERQLEAQTGQVAKTLGERRGVGAEHRLRRL